ncbi:hypothetical protein HCA58_02180 [Micromonospora sp. HNM0581]|uniref:hypothetical protein n=1 Tax=Micromonospora sp. HNM0581 TaxID=2716341 RepID=UPI00146AA742|nr:hypothetical protein [Micromonospora sp. HNM0581]NLU77218.1 hypothetical protein [Micromonospora sp. HNM0581]
MKSGRGRPAARVWWALPLLLAIVFVPVVPAAAVVAAPDDTGKYYMVGPPVDGQREYLYRIAVVTLGNGNRFREIIELNRGRQQPDGSVFTDGVELGPGWILALPRDADGPGVRTGPLPSIGPPTPSSAQSTAKASPGTAAPPPSPSPKVTTRPVPNAEPPPVTTASSPAVAAPTNKAAPLNSNLIRIGAGILAVLLAVGALLVLPRRIQGARSVTLDDGPWPPERHHTPTPAELDAGAAATPQPAPPGPLGPPPLTPPIAESPSPSTRQHPARPNLPVPPSEPQPPAEPGPLVSSGPRPDWLPRVDVSPIAVSLPPPVPPELLVAPALADAGGHGEQVGADVPRPALPADGDVPYVRAEVRTEAGPIVVRLIGVTSDADGPAYAWLADDEPATFATVPLVLGHRDGWRLQVDLSRAPDVFTLVGELDECRRLAAAYARQLRAGGIGVAVVGDALGTHSLDDCRRLDGLPAPGDLYRFSVPGDLDADRYVVVTTGLPKGTGIRGLAASTGGRCIPMVIGPVPNGRWTAQLGTGE